MSRGATPGKPSTLDLLRWPDNPDASLQVRTPVRVSATNDSKGFASASDESFRDFPSAGRSGIRTHQPAGGASTFAFTEQVSSEEAEALLKRKPLSETKKKEMSGNKIFSDEPSAPAPTPERTGMKLVQAPSQIHFGDPESSSPKKPTTIPEIAKQRELSGSHETEDDAYRKKMHSHSKVKELVGSNIFSPSPEPTPPSTTKTIKPKVEPAGPDILNTPERKRVLTQKIAELSGHNIFKEDSAKTASDKHLSDAKLKEMSGHDIFADDKPVPRECLGGVRKPPGGESTIALV